jgi:RimJ/RimL family protein N-acetyltransferase
MDIKFKKLTEPTAEIIEYLNKWENDPVLIPLIRPNKNKADLLVREPVTIKDLEQRLEHHHMYLIYLQDQLIGEMGYQIDPKQLYKKETGTAWIDIIIGEEIGRGRGIGYFALHYLEKEIKEQGLQRVELGVFEFNTNAIKLYRKAGYQEFSRIPDFTYWQNKMWHDIRMEKYV